MPLDPLDREIYIKRVNVALPLRLLLIAGSAVLAEDLTTLDGKTYKNYIVTSLELDGLAVRHEGGSARVPYERLPDGIRRRYGYFKGYTLTANDGTVYRDYVVVKSNSDGLMVVHNGGIVQVAWDSLPESAKKLHGFSLTTLITTDGKVFRNYMVTGKTDTGLAILHERGVTTVAFDLLPDDFRLLYGPGKHKVLPTLDGKEYRNAEVIEVAAEGAVVRHEQGTTKLAWSLLPEEIRTRYGYECRHLMTSEGIVYRNYSVMAVSSRGVSISYEGGGATVRFTELPPGLKGLSNQDPETDLLTLDGKLFRKYAITGRTANGLTIRHEGGAATILFKNLPEELRDWQPDPAPDAYDHDQAEARRQRVAEKEHEAALKDAHNDAAKALAEKKFVEAFSRSASRVKIGPGLESFWVCNGTWGKNPASLQAAGVKDYVGGLACNVTQGAIGMVPAYSGALRKGERKAWVYGGESVPSFVHFSKEEVDYLTGRRLIEFNQVDGKITKLSHDLKVWRIGKVKMIGVIGAAAEFPNYTTSSALAAKFYREHGFPEKSSKLVLEWSAVYQ